MPSRKHPVRNVTGEHRRALVKMLESITRGNHYVSLRDVFRDFVEMSALSIANRIPLSQDQYEKREKRYLEIAGKYDKEQLETFGKALGQVAIAIEEEGGDVLGDCYMGLPGLANEHTGQFFTPFDVSKMMALMSGVADLTRERKAKGEIVTMCEPCIGAGSIAVAHVEVVRDAGIDFADTLHVTGIDIDSRCAHMAYIALALRGVPAVVVHGNALSLEEWDRWYTPAHIANGWFEKLGAQEKLLATVHELLTPEQKKQLTLFEMPAEKAS